MRKLLLAVSVLAVMAGAAAPQLTARGAPPAVSISATNPYSPTEIVVRFRPGTSAQAMTQSLAAEGARRQPDPLLAKLGYSVVQVPEGQVLDTLTALSLDPNVEKAEPNYLRSAVADGAVSRVADTIPTDPSWGSQYGPGHVQGPAAWDIVTGTSAVVIAIIDTGVDLMHPDLVDKLWTNPGETGLDGSNNDKRTNGLDDDSDGYIDDWRGWDFSSNDNNPQDQHGHGTHVAGIAGAATNNAIGIAGMNWNARLMPVRVLAANGNGTDAQVAAGMVWATDHGATIINLSLGGPAGASVLEDAVNYAYSHGVLVVAAAGNTGGPGVIFPAAYDNALAIANTDSNDNRNSGSSYGPQVDLSAPGTSIYSTYWINGVGSTYGYLTGTSMATPHVAGVAALLAGRPQFNTPDKIRVALESTAKDIDTPGWDQKTGFGLIQAYDAVLFDADNATSTPTPIPPLVYRLDTSDSCPAGVNYDWQSAAGGTNTGIHLDEATANLSLPFTFMFNGQAETSATVTADGYLNFAGGSAVFSNKAIPNTLAPNDFVAPFWDDLDPSHGGNVYYQTFGSAPNRRLVIEWNGVPRWNEAGALTFQVVLSEGSNTILFQYQSLVSSVAGNASGGSATVGIEFAGGTSGYQHSYNTAGSVQAGLAILFTPATALGPACVAGTPTQTATVTQTPTVTPTPTITPTPVAVIYFPFVGQIGH